MTFSFVPSDEVARIRARIDHPVIDADGHLLEFLPLVNDIVREVAGDRVADRYQQFMRRALAPDDAGFMPARVFWGLPEEHTLDRMTVTLPAAHVPAHRGARPRLPAAVPQLRPHRARGARRRGARRGRPGAQHVLRRGVRRLPRPARTGRRDPHLHPRRRRSPSSTTRSGTLGLKAVVMDGVIPRRDAARR